MSTEVAWLSARFDEVPSDDGWLGAREAAALGHRATTKRRGEWRLGRWAAKRALALFLQEAAERPRRDLEIRAAADGAPEAWVGENRLPVALSLSHCRGVAICALARDGARLGCDLEAVEVRGPGFVSDYFTAREREALDAVAWESRALTGSLLWSSKESILKAIRVGLRRDLRRVEIRLPAASQDGARWQPVVGRLVPEGDEFRGWWRRLDSSIVTILSSPPAVLPRRLRDRRG